MLQYYTKQITNVDILEPKIMKLTYTRKTTFNINGTTIHSALAIPLNKNLIELNALSNERQYTFIKTYDQLCLLIIYEIFLAGNKMLFFIDRKLCIIKQVHNEFMGGLNVIMTSDFYQTPLVQNSRIFKPITNIFNTIALTYSLEHVQRYKLQEMM
jgi:hypothetical protein